MVSLRTAAFPLHPHYPDDIGHAAGHRVDEIDNGCTPSVDVLVIGAERCGAEQ